MLGFVVAAALVAIQTPGNTGGNLPPLDAAPVAAPMMSLVCVGGGQEHRQETRTVGLFGPHGLVNGYATNPSDVGYGNSVTVELTDESVGRIRIPATFVPPIHGGGVNGCWTIQNLKVGDQEITGKISFNVLDSPTFHIDRITGKLAVTGRHASFYGDCSKASLEDRKF